MKPKIRRSDNRSRAFHSREVLRFAWFTSSEHWKPFQKIQCRDISEMNKRLKKSLLLNFIKILQKFSNDNINIIIVILIYYNRIYIYIGLQKIQIILHKITTKCKLYFFKNIERDIIAIYIFRKPCEWHESDP